MVYDRRCMSAAKQPCMVRVARAAMKWQTAMPDKPAFSNFALESSGWISFELGWANTSVRYLVQVRIMQGRIRIEDGTRHDNLSRKTHLHTSMLRPAPKLSRGRGRGHHTTHRLF